MLANFHLRSRTSILALTLGVMVTVTACSPERQGDGSPGDAAVAGANTSDNATPGAMTAAAEENLSAIANPDEWPRLAPLSLDPDVEARVDEILAMMTLEQKVGQIIQADSGAITADEVREYRLGSVLSGGNSAPGPLPYADAETWLEAADSYFNASIDPEGVEIAIPIIWGIDAVHGHANLRGAVVFPHNIGLGAANDPDLIEDIYEITARELSVSGHDWTFAPTLAVPRNDRWGRTYEGFSESPDLVSSYADRIVYGLQGRPGTESFMSTGRVIASAKHFLADGGTDDGRDQGNASISEEELRDVHAAGYMTAVPAGVQTVMASFSFWNGVSMHGNESLLTDVLKDRMGFNGFVVGDWNGHGLIDGCTSTDCPEAFMAGVDMYMAPDSWRELYHSTLEHVRSGRISEDRLNDAVRRILRVKVTAGLFEQVAPSQRPLANDISVLAAPEHRDVARRAVRQSLVLLKNTDQLLPLDPGMRVLVVGPGADDIAQAAGGWTLSWQGGGFGNEEFPASQTILDGIREAVSVAGGEVIYDPEGTSGEMADVVIAVYGENPYAEFQGDRDHLDFVPTNFDTNRLAAFGEAGIPVVSVFLSGRPMWTNPEINASDAFVAAWLPGTEGGGIADMLFQTDPSYEFTGRLSFSWPRLANQGPLNTGDADYDPLFAFGFGLSYADDGNLDQLPEDSGLDENAQSATGQYYVQGRAVPPWQVEVLPASGDGPELGQTDRVAQEDSLHLVWRSAGDVLQITGNPIDLSRESNGAMELVFRARAFNAEPHNVEIGLGCDGAEGCEAWMPIRIRQGNWSEFRIGLSCFGDAGVDMTTINRPFMLRTVDVAGEIGLSEIGLGSDVDAIRTCGTE
jgi:beta-glucosidase